MGTGIIVSIIVIAGLAYLIPWFASRKSEVGTDEDTEAFAESMTLIRRAGVLVDASADECEVSTPMTRRAALYEVRQAHRAAAVRRRRVVLTLLAATLVMTALAVFLPMISSAAPHIPWWACAIPAGLLIAFLGVARYSVVSLQNTLDRRVDLIQSGWEEDTISFQIPADLREGSSAGGQGNALDGSDEHSVELSGPIVRASSLWDPIPVVTPTYVSKPLVPRTVRTIDLSAPGPMAHRVPVTNDTQAIEVVEESDETRPQAVGE